jgi:hypothetical protein
MLSAVRGGVRSKTPVFLLAASLDQRPGDEFDGTLCGSNNAGRGS